MRPFTRLIEAIAAEGAGALVSLIKVQGSSPREAGARMVVRPSGGFHGTIGGGELEWQALAAARQALAQGRGPARRAVKSLGPDLAQCCGGRVEWLIETFDGRDEPELTALAAAERAGAFVTLARKSDDGRLKRTVEVEPGADQSNARRQRDNPQDEERLKGASRQPAPSRTKGTRIVAPQASLEPALALASSFETALSGPPQDEERVRAAGLSRITGRAEIELLTDDGLRESFSAMRSILYLFGAGHVGRALVLALAPLPFDVRWIDGRQDAFPQFAPPNVMMIRSTSPANELADTPDGAQVLVMTHSHPLDLDIVARALREERFSFVGLIGSATKRARFMSQMRAAGLSAAALGKLVCPIGLAGVEGKEPAVIAASVAAQLLMRRPPA